MVKRSREDERSPKASKSKKLASKEVLEKSPKLLISSPKKRKVDRDPDYDARLEISKGKKVVEAKGSKVKISFTKSKSGEEGDNFDPSIFTEEDINGIHLQIVSDYSHLCDVVSKLTEEQKACVKEIGFGSLLDLKIRKLNPNLYMPVLMNYNAGGMVFLSKNGNVLFNKHSIRDVLGLPLSENSVELIVEDGAKRKGVDIKKPIERKKWYDFLGVKNPKSPYLSIQAWDGLFEKYSSGEDFKKLFVLFCATRLLSPRADYGAVVKCGRSLEDVSKICTYDWCGYVMDNLCAAIVDFHNFLKANKLEGRTLHCKVRGCVSALVLAVIHNFKCRNMDFTAVRTPYLTYWTDDEKVGNVIKVFGLNMNFALPVEHRSKGKDEVDAEKVVQKESGGQVFVKGSGSVSLESDKIAGSVKKSVRPESSSSRELVIKLPPHLQTDEEIDALDAPRYVKDLWRVKRNAIAFCELNLAIAKDIREEGLQLSQDSLSQEDSDEMMNEEFFNQIDDMCNRYFEEKEKAKAFDVSKTPLVKKTVAFDLDANKTFVYPSENAPRSDSSSREVERQQNPQNAVSNIVDDDKINPEDVTCGTGHADDSEVQDITDRGDEDAKYGEDDHDDDDGNDDDNNGDDDDDGNGNENKDGAGSDEKNDVNEPSEEPDHEDAGENKSDEQDVNNGENVISNNAGVQSTPEVCAVVVNLDTHSPGVGGNIFVEEREESSADLSKYRYSYSRSRKIPKFDSSDKRTTVSDFFNISLFSSPPSPRRIRDDSVPTFQLFTPSPINPPADAAAGSNHPDVVDSTKPVEEGPSSSAKDSFLQQPVASGNADSLKGFDDRQKEEEIVDLSSQKSSEHTPSPPPPFTSVHESIPSSSVSCGESATTVTPLQVRYPHVDGSYSSIEQTAAQSPKGTFASQSPMSTPELMKGWDYDREHDKFPKSTPKKTTEYVVIDGDSQENQNEEAKLDSLILQIKQSVDADTTDFQSVKGVEENKKKNKEKESSEVHTMDYALPVNNHHIVLSRTLQRPKNKYLGDLTAEDLLVADFLFYSEYEDVYRLSVNPDDPVVAEHDLNLQNNLEFQTLVDMVNPSSPDQSVQLRKLDFLSLAPRIWISGDVIDACAFMFNRREERQPGTPRKFWFNMLPFNYVNWLDENRIKQERFNSIIAEKEIDLEKAKGTPSYDTMKSEFEKEKAKMVARSPQFFRDRCRTAMSNWERSFPNNSIRDADLIFVPVHLDNHFTVLVINTLRKTIEDIDNRSDNKHFERYKSGSFDMATEMCRNLAFFFRGDRIQRQGVDGLQHWSRRTIPFPWRNNQNSFDCGLYAIKAMEWYDGENEKDDPIASLAYAGTKNLLRCKLAVELLTCEDNRLRNEVMNQCFEWSAKKPELLERQQRRKMKEKHLETLKNNRVKMVFAEDENIREQRRKHEKEVEDVLNDFYEDSARLAAILQYRYDQGYESDKDKKVLEKNSS